MNKRRLRASASSSGNEVVEQSIRSKVEPVDSSNTRMHAETVPASSLTLIEAFQDGSLALLRNYVRSEAPGPTVACQLCNTPA